MTESLKDVEPASQAVDTADTASTADIASPPTSPKPHFVVPHSRDENIVDRANLFENIEHSLSAGSEARQAALWGPGGCGKTHVAIEYAYRQHKNGSAVYWVHADTETNFHQDFSRIAKELGLDTTLKGTDLLTAVRGKLESTESWLLVLDNVKNAHLFSDATAEAEYETMRKYIPSASTGSVLWTSRSKSFVDTVLGPDKGIEVGHLTDVEALELLQGSWGDSIHEDEWEHTMALFDELRWFPLPISLAASYLRTSQIQLGEYLTNISEAAQEAGIQNHDSYNADQDAVSGVLKVWLVSAKKIQEDCPTSHAAMHVLSYLHNRNISLDLLSLIWKQVIEDSNHSLTKDEVKDRVDKLGELSLINICDSGKENYQMSEMLQDAIRYHLTLDEKTTKSDRFPEKALHVILNAFPTGKRHSGKRERSLAHALCIEAWTKHNEDEIDTSSLLARVSECLEECKIWGEKARVDQRRIELHQKKNSAQDDTQLPHLLSTLATSYDKRGQHEKAIELRSQILDKRRSLLGSKHGTTIHAMKELARTYYRQGDYIKAESTCKEVIALQTEVYGEKNRSTIRATSLLASTYRKQGRLAASMVLYKKVFDLKREILGEKDKSTINAMKDVASAECRVGNFNEAARLRTEILEIQRTLHGPRHKDVNSAMSNLASMYQLQGREEEAVKLRAEVLNWRRETHGDTHKSTIETMMALAKSYRILGRGDEALKLNKEALSTRQRLLGNEHPLTLDTWMAFANTQRHVGEVDEAADIANRVFGQERERLGLNHPASLMTMFSVANILNSQGRHRNAIGLMDECLQCRRRVIGADHRRTKEVEQTLGEWKAALIAKDGQPGSRARL